MDWFGPIEFAQMDPQFVRSGKGSANHSAAGSPESKFLENPVETATAELIKKANPLEYIHADLPAFIIEHGDADSTVPVQQSIALAEKLKAVLTAHKLELQVLPGARHGDPQFESDQNLQRVLEFLNRALPQS